MQGEGDEPVKLALGRPVQPRHRASETLHVHAGFMTRKCQRCRRPTWFGPMQLRAVDQGEMAPWCGDCVIDDVDESIEGGLEIEVTFSHLGNPGRPLASEGDE